MLTAKIVVYRWNKGRHSESSSLHKTQTNRTKIKRQKQVRRKRPKLPRAGCDSCLPNVHHKNCEAHQNSCDARQLTIPEYRIKARAEASKLQNYVDIVRMSFHSFNSQKRPNFGISYNFQHYCFSDSSCSQRAFRSRLNLLRFATLKKT